MMLPALLNFRSFPSAFIKAAPLLSHHFNSLINHLDSRWKSSFAASCVNFDASRNQLVVRWADKNDDHPYPLVWLRDNCQCPLCYDSSSQSRTITFAQFQLDHKPKHLVRWVWYIQLPANLIYTYFAGSY